MPSLLDELDRANGIEPEQPQVKRAEPFKPAVLPGTPELPAPGIYFGVPEEEYHAWPALSSHGIKDLAASPMLFWARRTWLSEAARKREAEEAAKPDKRLYRTIGKAYHCRILEGAEAYAARFACELSPDDCKDALESTDQIKAAISARGQKPVSKVPDELPDGTAYERAARKEDWIDQLEALDPSVPILARLQAAHGRNHAGKSFIPWDAHEQIEIAAAMIEADPQAKHAVKGGYPEVSLIWHCAETGVPMKARVDRLKLKAAVDLKSIACGDMSIERALTRAIAAHKYNFQPSVYLEGIQAVKALIATEGNKHIHLWLSGLGYMSSGTVPDEERMWALKWAQEEDEPEWWFLFQAKGIAPITRLKRYPGGSGTRYATDQIVRQAKRQFRELSERFGTEPWLDLAQASDINDDDLPNWVIEV